MKFRVDENLPVENTKRLWIVEETRIRIWGENTD